MAVYKVPQDVEAEDKFFGPFSFKQFIFFGGVAVCGYLVFLTASNGIWPLSIVFAVPMIAFGFLAFPWSKEQPTELWLAAHVRFLFMKRKRIWDQAGIKDLVTITAPKREFHALTDGLSQDEVRNRFNALASVVDSRGWAVKNLVNNGQDSDRLATASATASTFYEEALTQEKDVLDAETNPLARQFDELIDESANKQKQQALNRIQEARDASRGGGVNLPAVSPQSSASITQATPAVDYSFLDKQEPTEPGLASFKQQSVVQPGTPAVQKTAPIGMGVPVAAINENDEQELLKKVHQQQQLDAEIKQHSHLKTILPAGAQQQAQVASNHTATDDDATKAIENAQASSATPVNPAILELAGNDDLNVETLARQAKKDMPDEGEVIISLH